MRFTVGHMKQCKTINAKFSDCKKIGHFSKVCQQREVSVCGIKQAKLWGLLDRLHSSQVKIHPTILNWFQ